jgi:hypothetical protein
VFTSEQLEKIKKEMIGAHGEDLGEALYNQEYLCSFEGAQPGAYYARQMSLALKEGRITEVPWTSGLEVYTFWDLGIDDSTTIWFMQFSGQQVRVIDYYEGTGYGFEHYAKTVYLWRSLHAPRRRRKGVVVRRVRAVTPRCCRRVRD